jgi:NADP-dependent 3-hydroxy acid dehydrogenase YdfG
VSAERGSIVVVGAGPGVGASVARRFGRDGHPVGLIARNRERLDALAESLAADGIASAVAVADVREPSAVREAIGVLERALGPAEVLCVSPLPDIATIKPVADTTAEDLGDALALGVVGTAAAVGCVLPAMRAARRGSLLFTTGSAALTPSSGRATSGVVNAAQSVYIRMLHDALAEDGVYALHAVIVGPIGDGGHDPSDIAESIWQAHSTRADAQIVIRRDGSR